MVNYDISIVRFEHILIVYIIASLSDADSVTGYLFDIAMCIAACWIWNELYRAILKCLE